MTVNVLHESQALEPGPRERARAEAISVGLPWVLVLVQAVALIVSGMVGLIAALFAWWRGSEQSGRSNDIGLMHVNIGTAIVG